MTDRARRGPRRPVVCTARQRGPGITPAAAEALRALTGDSGAEPAAVGLAPRTRADCLDGLRPCPWVRCRHHLAVSVTAWGSLQITWPGLQIGEMLYTCALDVVDEHPDGLTLEQIGELLNVTREMARRVEAEALQKCGLAMMRWR